MEKITKTPQASTYSYETSDRCYTPERKSPSEARQDVDLCLVSSCEFKHPKTELSPSFINPNPLEWFAGEEPTEESEKPLTQSGGAPPPSGGKQQGRQCDETPPTSVSESAPSQTDSDVPPETEECPSITADANIDSEDESETIPTDKTVTYKHMDPPPAPMQDRSPSPRHPDVSMVDPEALAIEQNLGKALKKDLKEKAKTKKPGTKTKSSSPVKKGDGKSKPSAASPKPGALKESSDKVSRVASPKKKESVEKAMKTTTTPEVKATRGEEKDKETKNAANASASKSVKTATAGRWGHITDQSCFRPGARLLLCLVAGETRKHGPMFYLSSAFLFGLKVPLLAQYDLEMAECTAQCCGDPSGGTAGLVSFWTAAAGQNSVRTYVSGCSRRLQAG